jgi:N-acetylmuramoyl-L-alanine amidase
MISKGMIKNVWFIGVFALLFLLTPVHASEKNFTVVIDAGHGGKDPGAKGSQGNEKSINLAVALKLGALISANHKDVNVVYTRKTDTHVDVYERADIANRNKADLFISIHSNSVKSKNNVKGAETYTLGLAQTEENLEVAKRENSVILLEDNYQQRYGGFDPNSIESYIIFEFLQNKNLEESVGFASDIQKAFTASKRANRGVRQAGFLVLKLTGMPGVLIELGFISNKEEEQYLRSAAGQNQFANSIYTAFKKYKNNHASKQVITASTTNSQTTSAASGASTPAAAGGKIVYKVQILSSDKQLASNSPLLKGYKADWYKEGNLYKYTYGESTDFQAIQTIRKNITKDFKDAFIIRMQDGKRLN